MTVLYSRTFARIISRSRFALLFAALAVSFASLAYAQASANTKPAVAHLERDFGKIPLSFEPNRGQADARVQFLSRGRGYSLYLTPGEAVIQLQKPLAARAPGQQDHEQRQETSTFAMRLIDANRDAAATAQERLPGTVNSFIGNDRSKWQTGLNTYKRVAYAGVYPGIDLVYYGNQRALEYDFLVGAGADPAKIAFQFEGASAKLDPSGDLVLGTGGGETSFHKPVIYQMDGIRRVRVEGRYTLAANRVHFALGAYDHSKPLVIDPVLSYLTYLGGSRDDTVTGMAVDSTGSVYIVGTTSSIDFPVKNAYKGTDPNTIAAGNPLAIFVSKFNATGTALVYSTYLGSSEYSYGTGIAVDSNGNAYVTGYTSYGDYPVTAGAYQTICGANNYFPQGSSVAVRSNGCGGAGQGGQSGTLTKLDPTGATLVYSTYLSGGNGNQINAVAVDAAGEAYVTGVTNAVCPGPYNANGSGYQAYFCIATTANASEPTNSNQGGDTYGFVVKFNAQGTGLLYSTALNNHNPAGHSVSGMKTTGIALDAVGNAYVTGYTDTAFFITTSSGALQTSRVSNTSPDFVAKFNPAGTSATSLAYSTYLSGTTASNDVATGIAVDGSGNAVVTGYTNSCTFPTTAGAFSTVPGGYVSQNICAGGFLSKLNAAGSGLVWSTYTGNNGANGRNNDDNDAVAVGPDGSVYVAGDEQGVALSPTVNPIFVQSESHFTYIKKFKADGTAVTFSTAVGGTTDATSIPASIFVDATNNIYLAGSTNSSTYPTTAGAFQKGSANPGVNYNDGFVVKIAPTISTTTTLTLPSGTVTAGQSATFTAKVAGAAGTTSIPTGTVTFLSGSTILGTGTLDGTGTASYTATSLNATTYTVTASYPGDSNFSPSVSAAQALVVSPATATVALTAPATATPGASVTLSLKVTGSNGTPTGSVTFKDGAATLATVALVSGAASYTSAAFATGSHSLTASYTGDSIYGSASSSTQTLVVALATPTVTLTAPATALAGASVTLSASVAGTPGTPTGSVTFKDGNTVLSTVALTSGAASYTTTSLAAGAHAITASYSGDSTFSAVMSAASTVTISVAPAITFAASPSSLTVTHGMSVTSVITGTPVGGYTGSVTFSCGTLPAGASCVFAPSSLTFSGNNVATSTTLTFSTATTTMASLESVPATRALGGVFAAVLLMPFLLRQKRMRAFGRLLLWILIAGGSAALLGLGGCADGSKGATTVTTAPGVYVVPVTVTAGAAVSTVSLSITVQ